MYAIVRFPYNHRIDEGFITRYFEPCPKVGGICRTRSGAVVIFQGQADGLARELEVFLEPGGLFEASWGELIETLEPVEWQEAIDGRIAASSLQVRETPPCGSNCQTCPQYRSNCRGCPVTPLYLGDEYPLD